MFYNWGEISISPNLIPSKKGDTGQMRRGGKLVFLSFWMLNLKMKPLCQRRRQEALSEKVDLLKMSCTGQPTYESINFNFECEVVRSTCKIRACWDI